MVLNSIRTPMDTYIEYDGKMLKLFMFSKELPPLIAIKGEKALAIMKILSNRFGSIVDNGVETIRIAPLYTPAILVWIVASISSKPSPNLLNMLINNTPRSAVDLILELMDTQNGYKKNRPMIPYKKLYSASRIVLKLLKLHNYPIDV